MKEIKACQYFGQKYSIVFFRNIERVLQYLGVVSFDPNDWGLFLDTSKLGFKCVLNHNVKMSIPLYQWDTLLIARKHTKM